jgi:uncharacterized protein (TIGR00661 family)
MKILYAAANNQGAKIQLARFLEAMLGTDHQIKVAAYKNSSPKNINIDWTLNCLLNIYNPQEITFNSDNLGIYLDQIKYYDPDLIISDLEVFTSYIANILNITIWQCSSSIFNYALPKRAKYNLGLFKYYAHTIQRDPKYTQRCVNILDNSNGNFVYSHFGDTTEPPPLSNGFNWVRPYHQLGKLSIPCQHNIVAGLARSNCQIIGLLKKYADSIAFTTTNGEKHHAVQIKNIMNEEEYFCNIKNSSLFLCQGQMSFLSDAFYNGKYALIYPDYSDAEALLNSHISQYLGAGKIITLEEDLDTYHNISIIPIYDSSIKFLHQKIEEIQ